MDSPLLSKEETEEYFSKAAESPRHRSLKILHQPGDYLNRSVSFLLPDTYMQPHFHPHAEKIETIRSLQGKIAVLFFDDKGEATKSVILEPDHQAEIDAPAFMWHTYVILSERAISFETMPGGYDPASHKTFASWAPAENTPESGAYLEFLKKKAIEKTT